MDTAGLAIVLPSIFARVVRLFRWLLIAIRAIVSRVQLSISTKRKKRFFVIKASLAPTHSAYSSATAHALNCTLWIVGALMPFPSPHKRETLEAPCKTIGALSQVIDR